LRALRLFDGCAVVSDVGWIRETSGLACFLTPCPVRVFAERDRAEAAAWLAALPEGPVVSVRLVPEPGVVVIDVAAPLRPADFDPLAATLTRGWRRTTRCRAWSCTLARYQAGRTSVRCCGTCGLCATTTAGCVGSRWRSTVRSPTSRRPRRGTSCKRSCGSSGYDALDDPIIWAAGGRGDN
jgi:hypothetical protein